MKSATLSFRERWCKTQEPFVRSERVALFVTYEHATVHRRRGRLLVCADEVRFPEACVDSEKITKNI